jgi:hypothetical protein
MMMMMMNKLLYIGLALLIVLSFIFAPVCANDPTGGDGSWSRNSLWDVVWDDPWLNEPVPTWEIIPVSALSAVAGYMLGVLCFHNEPFVIYRTSVEVRPLTRLSSVSSMESVS